MDSATPASQKPPAVSEASDDPACAVGKLVYAYDNEEFQPLSDRPGEAALRKVLRERFPIASQVDLQAAASAIASFARELNTRMRRVRLNTQIIAQIGPVKGSQDLKAADYLRRMFNVARQGNIKRWSRVWVEKPRHVMDVIDLARKAIELDGSARYPTLSDKENTASLKSNGPIPIGWMRGPVGLPIPTPASMIPFIRKAQELAAKPGRRSRWFEEIVLMAVAEWLSVLTGEVVHQPSYEVNMKGKGTIRTGPLIRFLTLIDVAFAEAAAARDPDRAEPNDCGTKTEFDGWNRFYCSLLSSGPRFECLGKGVDRKRPV